MLYRVYFKRANGTKGSCRIDQSTPQHARLVFEANAAMDKPNAFNIPFDATFRSVIEVAESTPKQKLAQKYGFILGSVKSAKVTYQRTFVGFVKTEEQSIKIGKAFNLVDSQFAKLERDIRDLFKLAGLKVK